MLAPLSKSKDPLVGFVARGDEAGARQQIERGVSPKELAAALWQTITFGHNSCMTKLLLKSGASVNIQDEAGYTPLINAVRARNSADVKLLLEAGANPNAQDRWGETPLRIAIRDGSSEIVELLQRAGARP